MRGEAARVGNARVALVIEELDGEAGIDGRLVGISNGAGDLVQAEAREQLGLVGNAYYIKSSTKYIWNQSTGRHSNCNSSNSQSKQNKINTP